MFVIFGWGKVTRKILRYMGIHTCSHCGNTQEWNLVKVRTWFTLFFVPVIPYSTKYVAMCPVCQWGFHTDKTGGTGLDVQVNTPGKNIK